MLTSDLHFDLPSELVAQEPRPERTQSQLLNAVDANQSAPPIAPFSSLLDIVQPGDLLVLNDTKVMHARCFARKDTGGALEILIEKIDNQNTAWCRVKGKVREGTAAEIVTQDDELTGITLEFHSCQNALWCVQFSVSVTTVMEQCGTIPLPPYMNRTPVAQDNERYQTVYADATKTLSAAAPTSGLHFSRELLQQLADKGVGLTYVTLHIGSGTYAPIRTEHLEQHNMHAEWIQVKQETCDLIERTRKQGGRVIACGTTVLRALETARGEAFIGETSIFIQPGYRPFEADILLTNFHMPNSTLVALVYAYAGTERLKEIYKYAIKQRLAWASYGDAMIVSVDANCAKART